MSDNVEDERKRHYGVGRGILLAEKFHSALEKLAAKKCMQIYVNLIVNKYLLRVLFLTEQDCTILKILKDVQVLSFI